MLKKKLQEVSSKKEIIFIIDSPFPYYSGGRETWLFHICNSLITNGDSIYLVNQKKSAWTFDVEIRPHAEKW